ncbi:MAG: RsmB/NOP family class I SAM-dependent RNA methyltransferase [Pseudomonadota bacterium]
MRDAARIQTAIDIFEKIEEARIPMDNTIRDYMKFRRYIGSKDRKYIVELVYNVMRSYARLNWWIEKEQLEPNARTKILIYLVLIGSSEHDILIRFTGEKHCPEPLSEAETSLVANLQGKALDDSNMPEEVLAECPEAHLEKLRNVFDEEFLAHMQAMQIPAQMDLRVNTIKVTRERAQEVLAADSVETIETPYSPYGLRAVGKPYMSATKAFHKGLVEIQDEGSQLISYVCQAKPGMRVLDYCAGSGGKTLGIAAQMEGKGIIYAMDNNSRRLEKGRRRYKKAGIHNVEVRSLEDEKNRKWLRRQEGAMDIVLVDAPCSSSGTWRRNPDYRWYQYGPSLEEIKSIQADILNRVADKVKSGGYLIYATCSLFIEENESQVDEFLKSHSDYQLQNIKDLWPSGSENCPCDGPYLRLFTKDHNTDGFFTAILKKQ